MDDLPEFLRQGPANSTGLNAIPEGMTLNAVEKEVIRRALEKSNWNQSRAAQQLGITRKILISRMAKYEIDRVRRTQPQGQVVH